MARSSWPSPGVVRSADPAWSLLAGWSGSRYFLFGIAAIIAITIACDRGRWDAGSDGPGLVLAMLLSIGVIWDFRILAPPTLGWADEQRLHRRRGPVRRPGLPGRRLGYPLAGAIASPTARPATEQPPKQEVLGSRPVVGDQRAGPGVAPRRRRRSARSGAR